MVENARRATRRRKAAGDSAAECEGSFKAFSPFVKRKIPFFDIASEDQLNQVEQQAEWLMQEIGLEFHENENALKLWREAGADVKGTRVRFPRGMVKKLCETIPSKFTQKAFDPAFDVVIGEDNVVFAPVYGPPFVRCLDKGRRYGSLDDFTKLVKIVSSLPHLHHSGFVVCEPCDIPVNQRHLDMVYTHLRYSNKPCLGAITARIRAQESVEMAKIYYGEEKFNNHCVIMGNVNTNSPLLVDKVVTEAIEVYSGAGQGMIVAPFILGGAMGPLTTAGAIAQAFAEAITCGAYTQLVRKGAPFIMGNFLSSMNLRSGAPTFGTPEPVLSNYIIGQLARRMGLPLRSGGSLTASKLPDAQAAYESADSMHSTAIGGANFVLHSAGWLEGGLVTGYEKLVLDADRLGAYAKLLTGFNTDENSLAQSAYHEVAPAGHFLGSQHTLANYKNAYYEAKLSDSNSFEQWSDSGGLDTAQRANQYWKKLLEEYQAPLIDPATDEELQAYMQKCKQSRPDMWY